MFVLITVSPPSQVIISRGVSEQRVFVPLRGDNMFLSVQHECGRCSQRGEPQHQGDEQQRNMAHLSPSHRCLAHHPAQHSLLHRSTSLDPDQRHPQPGQLQFELLVIQPYETLVLLVSCVQF